MAAAVECRGCSSYRRNFDKIATVHEKSEVRIQKTGLRTFDSELRTCNPELGTPNFRNGKPCNRSKRFLPCGNPGKSPWLCPLSARRRLPASCLRGKLCSPRPRGCAAHD